MKLKLIKIGNSRGVIIPKVMCEGLGEFVEISIGKSIDYEYLGDSIASKVAKRLRP